MATTSAVNNPPLSTALQGDPPSGAVTDGAHAIADLLLPPSKEADVVPNPPASSSTDTVDSKKEKEEQPIEGSPHPETPHRSKGKIALIMSALCVSFGFLPSPTAKLNVASS